MIESIREIEARVKIAELFAHVPAEFHPLIEAAEKVYIRRQLMHTDDWGKLYTALQTLGHRLNELRDNKPATETPCECSKWPSFEANDGIKFHHQLCPKGRSCW
jgi:sulfur transfer protein SufE